MANFICYTCGVQYAPRTNAPDLPPEHCPVCDDDRQYVGADGQKWTTTEDLLAEGRRNLLSDIEPGLTTINTVPPFAIGQQAQLIQTPAGQVLWDSLSLCEPASVEAVRARGGIAAIAISHPHFNAAMVDWSEAFGGVPIWIHADDREWVMRPDPAICYWTGDTADPLLGSGLSLVRVGGHFLGSTDLLWPAGANGKGVLFTGDMPQVAADLRWVTFLYSYPNMIPVSASAVRRIAATLAGYRFDRIYGSWTPRVVAANASLAVAKSAERYLRHLED